MKKLFVSLLLVAFAATTALASDVVIYAKDCTKGSVTFDHKAHAEYADGCANAACHGEGTPTKIIVDKKTAHGKMCKLCHKQVGGPVKCAECHKK